MNWNQSRLQPRTAWSAILLTLILAASVPACAGGRSGAGTSSPASPPAHATPANSPRLLFADDFATGQLDGGKWRTCFVWASESGCTNAGNKELQWYVPQQVTVADHALQLQATREQTPGQGAQGQPAQFPYRSGMVTTGNHFQFTYGYLQFRARASNGAQMWPAVWLIPASGTAAVPEIDVFEAWGQNTQTVDFFYHPPQGGQVATQARVDITSWHTYGLEWTPSSLTWYVDGHPLFTTPSPPQEPMSLVANLAVDGSPYSGPLASSGTLDLAQVRVWSGRPT
jgi:beta-glucanase (GH16 family)